MSRRSGSEGGESPPMRLPYPYQNERTLRITRNAGARVRRGLLTYNSPRAFYGRTAYCSQEMS